MKLSNLGAEYCFNFKIWAEYLVRNPEGEGNYKNSSNKIFKFYFKFKPKCHERKWTPKSTLNS